MEIWIFNVSGQRRTPGVFRETDGKYRGGEMPLIKVIWNLIGYVEVCRSGGLCWKKWQFKVSGDMRLPHILQIIHPHPWVTKVLKWGMSPFRKYKHQFQREVLLKQHAVWVDHVKSCFRADSELWPPCRVRAQDNEYAPTIGCWGVAARCTFQSNIQLHLFYKASQPTLKLDRSLTGRFERFTQATAFIKFLLCCMYYRSLYRHVNCNLRGAQKHMAVSVDHLDSESHYII